MNYSIITGKAESPVEGNLFDLNRNAKPIPGKQMGSCKQSRILVDKTRMFSWKELNLNKREKYANTILFTKHKMFESNLRSDWLIGTMVTKYLSQEKRRIQRFSKWKRECATIRRRGAAIIFFCCNGLHYIFADTYLWPLKQRTISVWESFSAINVLCCLSERYFLSSQGIGPKISIGFHTVKLLKRGNRNPLFVKPFSPPDFIS